MSKADSLKEYTPEQIVVLDTETTGIEAYDNDEVLSLSMVDGSGSVLLDEMYKPSHRKRWPKAESINGITPAMVADKQPISASKEKIEGILANAKLIVGYNLEFDLGFLEAAGIKVPKRKQFDVMEEFAKVHGEWDVRHEDWCWFKLGEVADYYGYSFDAHSSLEDAKATAKCFHELVEDPWFDEPRRKPRLKTDEFGDEYLDYGDDEERIYYPVSHVEPKPAASDTQSAQEMPEEAPAAAPEGAKTDNASKTPHSINGAIRTALIVLAALLIVLAVVLAFSGAIVPGVIMAVFVAVTIGALRR